jgi:AcrR family transcriptional regulator
VTELPKRADARRNRALILAAAEEAFAAKGIAVPLDDIARRAGVGPGTVYRHFPTKDALFDAVLGNRIDNLLDGAAALLDASDPGKAFFGLMSRMIDDGIAKKDLVDALLSSDRARTPTMHGKAQLRKLAEQLLRRAQRAGAVRRDVSIDDAMAAVRGIVLTAHHGGGDRRQTKRLFELVRDGMRPR